MVLEISWLLVIVRSFNSCEVKKRERELYRKWRIVDSVDKFGIDGKEKGNKMLCEKYCKFYSTLIKESSFFFEFLKFCYY